MESICTVREAAQCCLDFVRLCEVLPLVEESREWPMRLRYAASIFSELEHEDREFLIDGLKADRLAAEPDYLERLRARVDGLHPRLDALFAVRLVK